MEEYVCWRKTLQAKRDLPFPYLETYRKNDIFKKQHRRVCARVCVRVFTAADTWCLESIQQI